MRKGRNKLTSMKKFSAGFTLIELMIVVAQVSEGLNLSGGAKAAVTEYFQDRGTMPTTNLLAGLAGPAEIQGKYVSLVTVVEGTITVTYGNSAHAIITGAQLDLTPDTQRAGSVQWLCTTGTTVIENKHLPSACRT